MYDQQERVLMTNALALRLEPIVDDMDVLLLKFSDDGAIAAYLNPAYADEKREEIEGCDIFFIFHNKEILFKFADVDLSKMPKTEIHRMN